MSNKVKSNDYQNDRKYAVIRNGARVSDSEYNSRDDARDEYDHWHRVITRWPDGSKLEIVELKK